jgi:hypothetical protein
MNDWILDEVFFYEVPLDKNTQNIEEQIQEKTINLEDDSELEAMNGISKFIADLSR